MFTPLFNWAKVAAGIFGIINGILAIVEGGLVPAWQYGFLVLGLGILLLMTLRDAYEQEREKIRHANTLRSWYLSALAGTPVPSSTGEDRGEQDQSGA